MEQRRTIALLTLMVFFYAGGTPRPALASSCDVEKTFGREDKTLFARHCGVCHSLSGLWARVGPPLKGLFEKRQLLTGKEVTDENVREIIRKGGPKLMPGFQYMLTEDQVNSILQDIKESRCTETPVRQGN
ncbi:MAG: c-type cytochrome [Terriglobia bacterium]